MSFAKDVNKLNNPIVLFIKNNIQKGVVGEDLILFVSRIIYSKTYCLEFLINSCFIIFLEKY